MLISVVITTRNEERNIRALLDSLMVQEGPLEIVVVDAASEDRTRDIVTDYASRSDTVQLTVKGGTRGTSRNHGIEVSRGDAIAFIDADCIANPFWLKTFRGALGSSDIVAGNTVQIGYRPFEDLERV